MKVLSKEQFDAIQYTSIEVIRDFADSRNIPTVASKVMMVGGRLISPGEWLVVEYDDWQTICHVLSDEEFHEQYISADALDLAAKHAVVLQSSLDKATEHIDDLNSDIEAINEKLIKIKELPLTSSMKDVLKIIHDKA